MRREWAEVVRTLRSYSVPEAVTLSDLAADAECEWRDTVILDTWGVHGLRFLPIESQGQEVRVRWSADVFDFQLLRDEIVITADRASAANARAVLDAFLLQLGA